LAPVAPPDALLATLALRLDTREIDRLFARRDDALAAVVRWHVPLERLSGERRRNARAMPECSHCSPTPVVADPRGPADGARAAGDLQKPPALAYNARS
jgi:hypothetical protein